MADRTSAEIFGELFNQLAHPKPLDRESLAQWLWRQSQKYDFSPEQLGVDKALIKLGLARKEGDEILYKGDDGF